MSKIHEALKKAEQERGVAPQADATPATHPPAVPVIPRENLRVTEEPAPAVLTFESLLAHCPQPRWSPEPKTAQLFESGGHAAGSEELRTLRSRLYQIRDHRPLRTVLVTSSLPAEGKTFIAANLAQIIIRQHERRALVIDADLRGPQLHAVLGAPSSPGLSDYLCGQADEISVVQRGHKDNLFFIPAGKRLENPAELIANGRLQVLLERLAPLFDWVILDSPPVIPVADPSVMAKLCDGVLFVVHSAVTPFDLAQKARQQFPNERLLGVVLNQVDPRDTYGGYYYGYYGHNGREPKKK